MEVDGKGRSARVGVHGVGMEGPARLSYAKKGGGGVCAALGVSKECSWGDVSVLWRRERQQSGKGRLTVVCCYHAKAATRQQLVGC